MTMATEHLCIAGVTSRISTDDQLLTSFLARTGAYKCVPSSTSLILEVEPVPSFVPQRPIRATFPAPDAAFEGGRFLFWRRDLEVAIVPGEPAIASARCEAAFGIAVENILRLCLSTIVPLRGGLMLHASAVCRNGAGYVFTGLSGAGKSTIVKLLTSDGYASSLGDEVAVVSVSDAGAVVHSTPFGGELAPVGPNKTPLHRLFLLDPRGELPAAVALRTARLLRNALVISCQPDLGDALLATASELVTRVDFRSIYRPSREQLERALLIEQAA